MCPAFRLWPHCALSPSDSGHTRLAAVPHPALCCLQASAHPGPSVRERPHLCITQDSACLPPMPCFPNRSAAQGLPSESNGWVVGTARSWVWRWDLGTLRGLCKGSWCCWRPGKCVVGCRLQVVPQPHRTPPSTELCLGDQVSCSLVGAKSPGSVTLVSRSPYLLSPGTLSVKWGVGVEHHGTVCSPHQPPGLCRCGAGEASVGQVGPLREPLHSTEGHAGTEV